MEKEKGLEANGSEAKDSEVKDSEPKALWGTELEGKDSEPKEKEKDIKEFVTGAERSDISKRIAGVRIQSQEQKRKRAAKRPCIWLESGRLEGC